MTDLSIIIVSFNTRELLRDCLASVPPACDALAVETFVVDNASRDASAEMVEREFPGVRVIRNHENRGFAYANNVALEHATGRYVLLLNSDTIAKPGSLTRLVAFMDEDAKRGYCGPRLLNGDGSHQPSARRFPTPLSSAAALISWGRKHPTSRHTLDLHLASGDTGCFRADWLCGACLLARAEAVTQVGPLDDGYFLYFEETDWCRRMAQAGWQGWYVGDSEVVHLGGQSVVHTNETRPFSGDHPKHWVASSRRYLRRHHGASGAAISTAAQASLYALVWLKHAWRGSEKSKAKASTAAAALRHLFAKSQPPVPPRTERQPSGCAADPKQNATL